MTRSDYDVVVVGAGPAGCIAAKYAALSGARTLILEEHPRVGLPVQCAGLISRKALEESEIRSPHRCIASQVQGFTAYSPSLIALHADYKGAVVIRRDIFDRELAISAVRAGADILTHAKVVALRREHGISVLKIVTIDDARHERQYTTQEIRAKVVVGADGVGSIVAKSAGMSVSERCDLLKCVQVECAYDTSDKIAEVFISRKFAPGFFAWSVPAGDNVARIGLCTEFSQKNQHNNKHANQQSTLIENLNMLFRHPVVSRKLCTACAVNAEQHAGQAERAERAERVGRAERLKQGSLWRKVFALNAGVIPIPKKYRTVSVEHGVLLVGDAAGQVKPISGGGVRYGIKCGKIAGEKAAEAALSGDMRILHEYERIWMQMIGSEISLGIRIHKLRRKLQDNDFDSIFHALKRADAKISDFIAGEDMDFPSGVIIRIVREMLMRPSSLKFAIKSALLSLFSPS